MSYLSLFCRRTIGSLAAGALVLLLPAISASGVVAQPARPNLVVILVDDMGYSDLGVMGGEIETPAIDALAENGILYTDFYNSARCWPTRASLLTGRYHHRAGLGGASPPEDTTVVTEPGPYQGYLNESPTFAEVLSQAGYRTYMSGKWHLGARREQWPRRRGFDRYFGLISGASSYFEIITNQRRIRRMVRDDAYWWPPEEGFYMTEAITDSALAFMKSHTAETPDDPFLLYVAYTAPHWPLHALDEDMALYEGRFDTGWDSLREQRYRRMLSRGLIDDDGALPPRPPAVPSWNEVDDKRLWARRMQAHAAMIHRVDLGIGELVSHLRDTDQLDNTLVLFLSDNGASAENVERRGLNDPSVPMGKRGSYDSFREPWANVSNTPYRRYKATMYEGGIRTPMIAHWPRGIRQPRQVDVRGHVIDIAPTLYDVAGVAAPSEVDGASMKPVFVGNDVAPRPIYFEHLGSRAMLLGDYKIVADRDSAWKLFNVQIDPFETRDIASQREALTDSLVSDWTDWALSAGVRLDTRDAHFVKPNLLILVADDAGWTDFGAYGNPSVMTPNVDELARTGVLFERALLSTPQCSPSRISILTGKYPHATGAEDLHMPLPDGEVFVSSLLADAGYATGHLKKTHYGPNGEEQFQWYSRDLADFPDFLDWAGNRPFFLWVGFTDPHRPYGNDHLTRRHDPGDAAVPDHLIDSPETRQDLADYYDEIARMDSVIGSYVAELERRDLRSTTAIIFLSDNGAPFPRAKGTLYDAGIRTPLIISWTGMLESGARREGPVSVIDLAPTLLEMAGSKVPESMHGRSMLELLTGERLNGRTFAFSERNWHNCDEHQRSVTNDRYKLIQNAYLDLPQCTAADITASPAWQDLYRAKQAGILSPTQRLLFSVPRPEYELYDLQNDPSEYVNLVDHPSYVSELAVLKDVLEQWKWETEDFPPERRRRSDNTDRVTGIKFMQEIPEMVE